MSLFVGPKKGVGFATRMNVIVVFLLNHLHNCKLFTEQPVCAAARNPLHEGKAKKVVVQWPSIMNRPTFRLNHKEKGGLSYRSYRFVFVFILSRRHLRILEAHRLCCRQYSDLKVN